MPRPQALTALRVNGRLSHLDTAPVTGHYTMTYLHTDSSQDMVVFRVPEPASLALLGLRLLGLGMSRRNITRAPKH